MRKPKAHLFNDGGGMVTGTHDVKAARLLLAHLWLSDYDWDAREDIVEASRQFRAKDAFLETGRIVPNNPETGDPDYTWFWRSGYALGKPGVTRAVVWHA